MVWSGLTRAFQASEEAPNGLSMPSYARLLYEAKLPDHATMALLLSMVLKEIDRGVSSLPTAVRSKAAWMLAGKANLTASTNGFAADAFGQALMASIEDTPPATGSSAWAHKVVLAYDLRPDVTHAFNRSVNEDYTDLYDVNSDGLPDVVSMMPGNYSGEHGPWTKHPHAVRRRLFRRWVPVDSAGTDGV